MSVVNPNKRLLQNDCFFGQEAAVPSFFLKNLCKMPKLQILGNLNKPSLKSGVFSSLCTFFQWMKSMFEPIILYFCM